jgi:glutamyl-tRNA reductase
VRPERAGVATLTLTWREATTTVRQRAATALDDAAWTALVGQGVEGLVPLATCARSMWFLTAEHAPWAAALVQSALAARTGADHLPTIRVGDEALRHALRVAAGLDSYAEGEADIGTQFAAAFAEARRAGRSCRTLNLLAQAAARVVTAGRASGFVRPTRGLAPLAVEALRKAGVSREESVAVAGTGAIGARVVEALRRDGHGPLARYNRTPGPGVSPLAELGSERAVVLCTAAPGAWFDVPDGALVVDLGSPRQSRGPAVDLDALLSGAGLRLSADKRAIAEAVVEAEGAALEARLAGLQRQRALQGLRTLRDDFLATEVDALFVAPTADLGAEQRRRVLTAARAAIRAYNHQVVAWLREREDS